MKFSNLHTISFKVEDDTTRQIFKGFIHIFIQAGHTVKSYTENHIDESEIVFTSNAVLVESDGKLSPVKTAAFDVQGTLLGPNSGAIVNILKFMKSIGIKIVVWTGGDTSDSVHAVKKLKIEAFVDECDNKFRDELPGIAFDDDDESAILLGTLATIRV